MLTQSFVFRLLDLKKSSRRFLMFIAFCLFCSVESLGSGYVRNQPSPLNSELAVTMAFLQYLVRYEEYRDGIVQSPSGHSKSPGFDGPPGNEKNMKILIGEDLLPSPNKQIMSLFPKFKPGPPGNE